MRVMDRISARSDDMLIIHGVNVFPGQIEACSCKLYQKLNFGKKLPGRFATLGIEQHYDAQHLILAGHELILLPIAFRGGNGFQEMINAVRNILLQGFPVFGTGLGAPAQRLQQQFLKLLLIGIIRLIQSGQYFLKIHGS